MIFDAEAFSYDFLPPKISYIFFLIFLDTKNFMYFFLYFSNTGNMNENASNEGWGSVVGESGRGRISYGAVLSLAWHPKGGYVGKVEGGGVLEQWRRG